MAALAWNCFVSLLLLVCPGAWLLGRRPPGGWPQRTLLVAVALGPVVLAVEYLALKPVLPAGSALGIVLLLINLPAVLKVFRWRGDFAGLFRHAPLDGVIAALVFLPVAWRALSVHNFRTYGWHNLLQLGVVYGLDGPGAWPLDLDFSGQPLGYPWFGLLPLTVVAKIVNASPTMVFLPLNYYFLLVWAAAVRLSLSGAEETEAPTRIRVADGLAVLFAFTVSPIVQDVGLHLGLALEQRATPMTEKFFFVNAMTVALPLFSVLVMSSRATGLQGRRAVLLRGLLATSVALVYPLLAPAVFLYLLVLSVLGDCRGSQADGGDSGGWAWRLRGRELLVLAVGALVAAAYVALLRQGGLGESTVRLQPVGAAVARLLGGAALLSPLLFLALLNPKRQTAAWLCVPAFTIAYAVISLPKGVQYKYLFAAAVVLLPPAAESARAGMQWVSRVSGRGRPGPAVAGVALAVMLVPVYWSYGHHLGLHSPPGLAGAPGLDEQKFRIGSRNTHVRALVQSLRNSPRNTVVLSGYYEEPIQLYLDRPLFIPTDPPASGRSGFAMTAPEIECDVKGYSRSEFDRRREIRDDLLHGTACDLERAISQLKRVGANVAVISREASPCLDALRTAGVLRHLYSGGGITAESFGF